MLSAVLALFSVSAFVARATLATQYHGLFDVVDKHRHRMEQQQAHLNLDEISVESRISTVKFVSAVQSSVARAPLHSLRWLSGILQHQPALQLLALHWQHTDDADHQRLVLVGRVDDQVNNLVDGVTVFTVLVEALQTPEVAHAQVSKAPFGLGTEIVDTARVSANLDDRDFRIELTFGDQWWGDDAF